MSALQFQVLLAFLIRQFGKIQQLKEKLTNMN